ncbi:hypothetical protein B7939_01000 [Eggerthia catenaformis]|nr:hypothetical protein B7939_01000 [Eggerthia catenaformis]
MDEEIKSEKKFTLRRLNGGDIFPMVKIINAIGISEFSSVFANERIMKLVENYSEKKSEKKDEKDEKDVESIGIAAVMDIVSIIFSNLGKCRQDLGKFLASLTGMNEDTFWDDCDFEDPFIIMEELVKKPEFGNFWKVVSKYLH